MHFFFPPSPNMHTLFSAPLSFEPRKETTLGKFANFPSQGFRNSLLPSSCAVQWIGCVSLTPSHRVFKPVKPQSIVAKVVPYACISFFFASYSFLQKTWQMFSPRIKKIEGLWYKKLTKCVKKQISFCTSPSMQEMPTIEHLSFFPHGNRETCTFFLCSFSDLSAGTCNNASFLLSPPPCTLNQSHARMWAQRHRPASCGFGPLSADIHAT